MPGVMFDDARRRFRKTCLSLFLATGLFGLVLLLLPFADSCFAFLFPALLVCSDTLTSCCSCSAFALRCLLLRLLFGRREP